MMVHSVLGVNIRRVRLAWLIGWDDAHDGAIAEILVCDFGMPGEG
jgi:hypothetical protein